MLHRLHFLTLRQVFGALARALLVQLSDGRLHAEAAELLPRLQQTAI